MKEVEINTIDYYTILKEVGKLVEKGYEIISINKKNNTGKTLIKYYE